jgi:flagellar biosynthesis chaperone FliJ
MFSIKKWLAKGLSTNKLDNLLECKLQVKSNDDEIKNLQNAISELEKEIEKREEKNKKLEKEMLGCLDVLFEKENVEIGGAEIINKADKVDDEVKNEENIIEDKSYVNELDDV